MISTKAPDRPSINEVVRSVVSHGQDHFCKSCWAEVLLEEKAAPSPPPNKEKPSRPKFRSGRSSAAVPEGQISPHPSERRRSMLRRPSAILHVDPPALIKSIRRAATIHSNEIT